MGCDEVPVGAETFHSALDFAIPIPEVLVDLSRIALAGAEPRGLRLVYLGPVNIVIAWHQEQAVTAQLADFQHPVEESLGVGILFGQRFGPCFSEADVSGTEHQIHPQTGFQPGLQVFQQLVQRPAVPPGMPIKEVKIGEV